MLMGTRGKITKVSSGEDTIVYQVEVDDQTAQEFNSMQMFGVSSKAPVGSNCIVFQDGRIGFTLATEGVEYEIELDEGEVAIHNSEGNCVKFNKDGGIDIETKKLTINGENRELVTHAELDKALQLLVTQLNTHTHMVTVDALAAPAPPKPVVPLPTLTPLPAATLDISASKTENIYTS